MDKDVLNVLIAMFARAEEVFFVFDKEKRSFTYVNDAFEVVSKRTCQELFDTPVLFLKIIHKDDLGYVKQSFKLLLKKTGNSLIEFRICRPDNSERWIRLKVYPIVTHGIVQYLTGIAEDDSARKLGIFNMQKVNGWKDANLEIISHDLRGPIGIVQMLSSVIGKKMPHNSEIQRLTQLIEEISQRNIDLIQTVLSNEAIDTASVEISKERVNVVSSVHHAMNVYIESQNDLNKTITYTQSHSQIYAAVDNMKFLQIVNNLVSNSIKFTSEHGIIKVHLEKLDNSFLVTVADNGIGIPKKMQPILFKKYTLAGRKGVEGEESIGLGMWIVRTLTEAHHGRVWFESEPRKGSKFYVEIPFGFV